MRGLSGRAREELCLCERHGRQQILLRGASGRVFRRPTQGLASDQIDQRINERRSEQTDLNAGAVRKD